MNDPQISFDDICRIVGRLFLDNHLRAEQTTRHISHLQEQLRLTQEKLGQLENSRLLQPGSRNEG